MSKHAMSRFLVAVAALAPLALSAGCGIHPGGGLKKAEAGKAPLLPVDPNGNRVDVQDFEIERTQRSRSNTFFLWRVDESGHQIPGQVARASELADRVNDLSTQREDINALLDKWLKPEFPADPPLRPVAEKNRDFCDDCKKAYDSYIDEVALDYALGEVDTAYGMVNLKLEELKQAREKEPDNQQKIKKLETELDQTRALILPAESKVREMEFYKKSKESDRDAKVAKITDWVMQAKQLGLDYQLTVDKILNTVDYYRGAPESIVFAPSEGGAVSIQFNRWSLNPAEETTKDSPSFSTEDQTIKNVKYDRHGGRLRFDVFADSEGMVYSFDLVRTKYEQGDKDGRAYYSGGFTQKDASGKILRRGEVKIAATGGK